MSTNKRLAPKQQPRFRPQPIHRCTRPPAHPCIPSATYARAFEQAEQDFTQRLIEIATKRAVQGEREPVIGRRDFNEKTKQFEQVYRTRKNDRLLLGLIRIRIASQSKQ